jgi:peptide/nickel transport system substrate-binding protein
VKRRKFIAGSASLAATLSTPQLALSAQAKPVTFIPQSDLALLDPCGMAVVTRNHAFLVFDTLFGLDRNYQPQPQMLDSYGSDNGYRTWRLKLRDGLKFHDGEPVRAQDVVASLRRWAKLDTFGKTLFTVVDEFSATDDRTAVFRLSQPFPHLPDALAKLSVPVPFILPERLAKAEIGQLREIVGSGPFRFRQDEFVSGSRAVYERFEGYKPRESGTPALSSGPKVAKVDRVEWRIMADESASSGALQSGELDWWETPTPDLLPLLLQGGNLVASPLDSTGQMCCFYVNHLYPPFDNPGVRRAVLGAVDQAECMTAVMGSDPALWRVPVGIFCPQTPLANDTGIQTVTPPRDIAKAKQALAAAGYNGEKVVMLQVTDVASLTALGNVAGDMLKRLGMNVDVQSADWANALQRRLKKDPPDKGGWSITPNGAPGAATMNPGVDLWIRGNGRDALMSWPTSPKLEELRSKWLVSDSAEEAVQIARAIQEQCWIDVPYLPAGQALQKCVFNKSLKREVDDLTVFWGVERV